MYDVIFIVIIGFIIYILMGAHDVYNKAPYKLNVQATCVEKTKETTTYEEKGDQRWDTHTKSFSTYYLTWEYEHDGEIKKHDTYSNYFTFTRVGSKKTLKLYSNDGVEYKSKPSNLFTDTVMVILLLILGLIIYSSIKDVIILVKSPKKPIE